MHSSELCARVPAAVEQRAAAQPCGIGYDDFYGHDGCSKDLHLGTFSHFSFVNSTLLQRIAVEYAAS
jgi:hypothetical protein